MEIECVAPYRSLRRMESQRGHNRILVRHRVEIAPYRIKIVRYQCYANQITFNVHVAVGYKYFVSAW